MLTKIKLIALAVLASILAFLKIRGDHYKKKVEKIKTDLKEGAIKAEQETKQADNLANQRGNEREKRDIESANRGARGHLDNDF